MRIYEAIAVEGKESEGLFVYKPKDFKLRVYLTESEYTISEEVYNFICISKNKKPECPWFESSDKEYQFEIPVLYILQFLEKFLSTNNKKRGKNSS